ncbi:hypothetical protein L2E82_04259 [Cichorium intybus]|uniref:Uncharacterized protein n=1 Tax=Cichorium intybus TaxID=13427 RepID=A0ACB9H4S8_CICIN|nr:hypothetical protein L2E82_04259 [Cichorium intybus]
MKLLPRVQVKQPWVANEIELVILCLWCAESTSQFLQMGKKSLYSSLSPKKWIRLQVRYIQLVRLVFGWVSFTWLSSKYASSSFGMHYFCILTMRGLCRRG